MSRVLGQQHGQAACWEEAVTFEASGEHFFCPGQPAGNGALRNPKLPGCLLARQAFEFAQDDGGSIIRRQLIQFLIQQALFFAGLGRRWCDRIG